MTIQSLAVAQIEILAEQARDRADIESIQIAKDQCIDALKSGRSIHECEAYQELMRWATGLDLRRHVCEAINENPF